MTTLKLVGIFCITALLSLGLAFLLTPFGPFPFIRIFNRCLLVFGLTGAYLFRTRLQKKSFVSLGLEWKKESSSHVLNGIAFALLSLFVLTSIAYVCGAVSLYYHPPRLKKLFYYVTGALLTGFFEELIFRGILLKTLQEDFPIWVSVSFSSLIYSLAHFVQPLLLNKPEDLSLFYTESVGLFLFGVFMAYACLRTRSLYLSMGLHGGFIFFLKMDGIFVDRLMVKPAWLFGEERLIGGIVTWLIFPVAFLWVRWLTRRYFPTQNCEKIRSRRSSVNISPTISPKA